jgi:hypothetical protein
VFFNLKKSVISHLQNLPGWRTTRKIVVIESDDWGSIRMPSRQVYDTLKNEGYKVDKDPFLKYDSLASESDLTNLFEVLTSVKDANGNHPKITANTIVANPDFEKIRATDFSTYYFEPFTKTLSRYPEHDGSFNLWKKGMDLRIFHPQFHGREHINTGRWMKALQRNDTNVRRAFDLGMISISSEPSEMRFGYMEALDYFSPEEKDEKQTVIQEGLELFRQTFGYSSRSFIASCYVWDNEIEQLLKKNGVRYLQGVAQQLLPHTKNEVHTFKKRYHYIGQRNNLSQLYLTRNAYFEPCLLPEGTDHIGYCLKRMEIAFKMQKPAIIASHRLNFIGGIHPENRERNLKLFRDLLNKITQIWPTVEFMTSDELGLLISGRIYEK